MELPKVVEKLRPYLEKRLDKIDVLGLESLRLELSEAKVDFHMKLQEKRRQMLWPKDKDMTELDRKTRLDGDVAAYQRNYDFLVELDDIVKDRLELYRVISIG